MVWREVVVWRTEVFLNMLLCRNRTSYREVEDLDNNNYHSTSQTRERTRIWSGMMESIRNIKFLNSHAQRKY